MRGVGVFLVAKDGIGYAPGWLLRVRCPNDGIGVGMTIEGDFRNGYDGGKPAPRAFRARQGGVSC